MKDYKTTGFRSPQLVKSHGSTSTVMIPQPGVGKHIVITDCHISGSGANGQTFTQGTDSVRDTSAAGVIFYMPDEAVSNFISPIRVRENQGVWMTPNAINSTICYYIEDSVGIASY